MKWVNGRRAIPRPSMNSPREPTPSASSAAPTPRSGSRGLSWSLRILCALISLLVGIVALEYGVRQFDPFGVSYYKDTNRYLTEAIDLLGTEVDDTSRIFQNRRSHELQLAHFRFATDQLGLRASSGESVSDLGDSERKRILFLGDSVTLAWGVQDEDSWIRKLERNAKSSGGRSLWCMNAGHLQYNTLQEADLLRTLRDILQPDLVVVTFVTNDLTDNPHAVFRQLMQQVSQLDANPPGLLARARNRILDWGWGLRSLWVLRSTLAAENSAQQADSIAIEQTEPYVQGWKRVERGLNDIAEQCSAAQIPWVLFDHGTPRIDAVEEWCRERGVPYVDFNFTAAETATGVRISPADAHANPNGNTFLMQRAWKALAELGQLEEPE